MPKIELDLTGREASLLHRLTDDVLRDIQGDGTLSDKDDDALVTLNDKLTEATKGRLSLRDGS
jgi:hypothetical protein